jgi:DNA mismatch repair protein MutL
LIAAGEVIERPASVVKELMENSLDAGASRIEVSIEDGGRKSIRVSDDGAGIAADDLALAVHAHATSKLSDDRSLFNVRTMGFRGEALASVGRISEMTVLSRPADQTGGFEIHVEGGEVGSVRAAASAPGTVVEVRNLFFNTPARRKFLRTSGTEMGHISEQVSRIALGNRNVSIRLENNGRKTNSLSGGGTDRDRVAELFGVELADVLADVERTDESVGMSVRGLVASPGQSRASAKWQYVFLNGRYIRDRFILHAIREAFRGLIESGRHPAAFLWLEMDCSMVDVNVHPTKTEVRFADSGLVHSLIYAALRESLQSNDLTPHAAVSSRSDLDERREMEVRQAIADHLKSVPVSQSTLSTGFTTSSSRSQVPGLPENRIPRPGPDLNRPPEETTSSLPLPSGGAIQLHNTYLVAETPEGLIIVDQHALHERILFEDLRERINHGRLESQKLLFPEPIEVTATQQDRLEQLGPLLDQMGIEIVPFGPGTVAVQAFPSSLAAADIQSFMTDLLDRLADSDPDPKPDSLLTDMLNMVACKAAIKAGQSLSAPEIDALLAQRELVERSSNCPHGRPTSLRLTVKDLEKQFGRT